MFAQRLILLVLIAVFVGPLSALPDEHADAVKLQKEAAIANVKVAKLTMGSGETDNLLVYAPYSDEKVQTLATNLQKTYASAIKALKYESKHPPYTGKLTVMIFTDPKLYKTFALVAQKRSMKPKETHDFQLRGDAPGMTLLAGSSGKPTEATVTAEAAKLVAAALLNNKAGTTTAYAGLPTWLETGFGNAVYLRAEGNTAKLAAHKAKIRSLNSKTNGTALQLKYLWSDSDLPDLDTVTTSFAEYLVYGPGADKFASILSSFKPAEGNDSPTIESAFAAIEWKMPDVEQGWRKWVASSK